MQGFDQFSTFKGDGARDVYFEKCLKIRGKKN